MRYPTLPPSLPSGFMRSGEYTFCSSTGSPGTAANLNNRVLRIVPFVIPREVTLDRIGCEVTVAGDAGRTVTDGVTNSTTTLTSATAAFVSTDVGRVVTGTGIPTNTVIASVTNGTTAVMSNAATSSNSGLTIVISGCVIRLGIYYDDGNGYPGKLLLDAGASGSASTALSNGFVSGASNTVQEVTISQAVKAGLYWVGAAVQGITSVQPTVRTIPANAYSMTNGSTLPAANATIISYSDASATTALPSTFTSSKTNGTTAARIFVRTV